MTDVYPKTSGKLNIKLVDGKGVALTDVPLELVQYMDKYDNISLITKSTNSNGEVDFGELNAATYKIVTSDIDADNKTYNFYQNFQVIGGADTLITLKTTDYLATINVQVASSTTGKPMNNIGVFVIKGWPSIYWGDSVREYLSSAIINTQTNADGKVVLKVPSQVFYTVVAYNLNTYQLLDDTKVHELIQGQVVDDNFYVSIP